MQPLLVVIDDDLHFQRTLELIVAPLVTLPAVSIAEGIELLRRYEPLAAFVDVHFPWGCIDGIDSLHELQEACGTTQFVVVTVDWDAYDRKRAYNNGAYGYVEKLDPVQLREAAARAVRAGQDARGQVASREVRIDRRFLPPASAPGPVMPDQAPALVEKKAR